MTRSTRVLYPKVGWPTFRDSQAVTEFLWERCRDWQYINPTSGTSIWEDPAGTDGSIYVAYEGEDIVEFVIELGGNASEVASELENRFGLLTEAVSQFLGSITSPPNPPGIDLRKWTDLIAAHPNLAAFPDREGLNPFTKAPMDYRAHPGNARVMADGAEVGAMTWAQDGSHRIAVDGDPELVERVALDVASKLGGIFVRR